MHTRFQPGRSGNPRGRPKRLKPTAAGFLAQELYRPVNVREGENVTCMPAIQALIRKTIASACTGNASALKSLAALVQTDEVLRNHDAAGAPAEQPSAAHMARAIAAVFAEAEAEEARAAGREEAEPEEPDLA
jgi:hypothetical protein